MTTPILNQVEASLAEFRPRTQRELVALQIAKRFNDVERLAKYIIAAQLYSKKTLLEAAQQATKRSEETGEAVTAILFEVLGQVGEEAFV